MAGKININPDTVKGNLVLIIVVVATLGLLGYGWLQRGATKEARDKSADDLVKNTETYNKKKNYELPMDLGLTNSTGGRLEITTDVDHGNLALVKKAGTNFVSHLNRVRAKFAPLVIPDGLVLDEKTGAIISVTLMQRGTKYSEIAPPVSVKSVKGKGAELVASTRSMGGDTPEQYYVEKIEVIKGGSGYTKGDIAIIIGDDFGGGGGADPNGFDPSQGGDPVAGGDPSFNPPPGQMGMANQMGMTGSAGVSEDDSEARYGLDNDTFRDFMQSTVFGLQSRCKAQRIRLPQIEDESKDFRFSFSKVWNKYEFEPLEREVMYLAEAGITQEFTMITFKRQLSAISKMCLVGLITWSTTGLAAKTRLEKIESEATNDFSFVNEDDNRKAKSGDALTHTKFSLNYGYALSLKGYSDPLIVNSDKSDYLKNPSSKRKASFSNGLSPELAKLSRHVWITRCNRGRLCSRLLS